MYIPLSPAPLCTTHRHTSTGTYKLASAQHARMSAHLLPPADHCDVGAFLHQPGHPQRQHVVTVRHLLNSGAVPAGGWRWAVGDGVCGGGQGQGRGG